jgi:hypothetical protein
MYRDPQLASYVAWLLRSGDVEADYDYDEYRVVNDVLHRCGVPLLRRDPAVRGEGAWSIRWPSLPLEALPHQPGPPTTCELLNDLLDGVFTGAQSPYRFRLPPQQGAFRPLLWTQLPSGWRRQRVTLDTWLSIGISELARQALYAEQRMRDR